jgi:hypothetical protein
MSTGFLVGPWTQLKTMFARKRVIATLVFIAALIMTLVAALVVRHRDRATSDYPPPTSAGSL